MKEVTVLSLFDGISCGRVAFERSGIPVKRYVACEIDKYAIQVSKNNYPDIEHFGDVCNVDFTQFSGFDFLIGGSPCQDLCGLGSRQGLEGEKSSLFYEFVRAVQEVKPRFFLLENNSSMTQENKDTISKILQVQPIEINSILVAPQSRKRLYWTNIPGIAQPEDKKLFLKHILQPEEEKADYNITERMYAKKPGTLAYKRAWGSVRTPDEKFRCLTTAQTLCNAGATNIKYDNGEYYKPTPIECERGQTLPDNYTYGVSDTQRYKCIGNGWTVDVISHILNYSIQELGGDKRETVEEV